MTKGQIVTTIDRINNILMYKLLYRIELYEEFSISDIYPDLCKIGDWAGEIWAEWKENHPDYLPEELEKFVISDREFQGSETPTAISVVYKLIIDGICPDEVRASLSKFVDVMGYLHNDIEQYQRDQQGKLYGVPKGLQSDEALRLLDLCVNEGLLDEHYQPTPETKPFQLRLIAIGVGTTLKMDPLYSVFEKLWKIHELRNQSMPMRTKTDEKNKVVKLFPDVDFKKIISNRKKSCFFVTNMSEEAKERMYKALINNDYIDRNTSIEQWNRLFQDSNESIKPVEWLRGIVELAYFIDIAFRPCNYEYLRITCSFFTINGTDPGRDNVKTQVSKLNRKESEKYREYDKTLYEIANYR